MFLEDNGQILLSFLVPAGFPQGVNGRCKISRSRCVGRIWWWSQAYHLASMKRMCFVMTYLLVQLSPPSSSFFPSLFSPSLLFSLPLPSLSLSSPPLSSHQTKKQPLSVSLKFCSGILKEMLSKKHAVCFYLAHIVAILDVLCGVD